MRIPELSQYCLFFEGIKLILGNDANKIKKNLLHQIFHKSEKNMLTEKNQNSDYMNKAKYAKNKH